MYSKLPMRLLAAFLAVCLIVSENGMTVLAQSASDVQTIYSENYNEGNIEGTEETEGIDETEEIDDTAKGDAVSYFDEQAKDAESEAETNDENKEVIEDTDDTEEIEDADANLESEDEEADVASDEAELEEDIVSEDESELEEDVNSKDDVMPEEDIVSEEDDTVAEEALNVDITGNCGTGISYRLNDSGVMTIECTIGSGRPMLNYGNETEVPWYEFRDQIVQVNLDKGVTSVGDYAFYGCTNLTQLYVSESATTIGAHAFENCTSLNRVSLPSGIVNMGIFAFYKCPLRTAGPHGSDRDFQFAWKDTIPNNAFYYFEELESVIFEDSVKKIGANVFFNCNNLDTVRIGYNVKEIDKDAFANIFSYNAVTIQGYSGSWVETYIKNLSSDPSERFKFESIGSIETTLHFNVNTSDPVTPVPTDVKARLGEAYGEIFPVVTCEGRDLVGWFTLADGGDEVTPETICKEETTVYARWKTANCTITFDPTTGGAVSETSRVIEYDKKLGWKQQLPVPVKFGYEFDGWYTDIKDGELVTEDTVVKRNMTVYAHWVNADMTITFDALGGTCDPTTKTVKYLDPYGELPIPAKTGYKFEYWCTDKSKPGNTIVYKTSQCTNDITLYAYWTPVLCTITYDPAGGTVTPEFFKVNYDAKFMNLAIPEKEGYLFDGWYRIVQNEYSGLDEERKVSEDDVCKGDDTFTAHWLPGEYTVTFDTDGGLPDKYTRRVPYMDKIGSEENPLPEPVKPGFDFLGWYTEKNGAGTKVTESTKCTNTVTYYAAWEYTDYTVTFEAFGGTITPDPKNTNVFDSEKNTMTVKNASEYGTLPKANKEGYAFKWWVTDLEKFMENTSSNTYRFFSTQKCSGNITVYAYYVPITYTITFNANGGSCSTNSYTVDFDSPIGIAGKLPVPTLKGYIFDGWYRTIKEERYDEDENLYYEDIEVPVDASTKCIGDETLKAHWKPDTYKVKFILNEDETLVKGDSAVDSNGEMAVFYDGKFGTLPVAERFGCEFKGWWTMPDVGNGEAVDGDPYTDPGVKVTDETICNGDLNVYPHWLRQRFDVTFHGEGGMFDDDPETGHVVKNYAYLDELDELPQPKRYGYDFGGWYTEKDGEGQRIFVSTLCEGEVTYHAYWTKTKFKLYFVPGATPEITIAPLVTTYEEEYGELPIPVNHGYEFAGWFTDLDDEDTEITKTTRCYGEATVYAKWKIVDFTVTFDPNAGECDTTSKTVTYLEKIGELPTAERYGCTFDGWYTEAEEGQIITEDTICKDDITVYAHWIYNDFTVTFDANTGTVDETERTVKYLSAFGELPVPVKVGYTYTGWYTEAEDSKECKEVTAETICENDITVYAHWKANDHKIAFIANAEGATVDPSEKGIAYDEPIGELPVPVYPGYEFNGWYTEAEDGVKVDENVICKGDMTVYAHWSNARLTVTFVLNGGTLEDNITTMTVTYLGTYGDGDADKDEDGDIENLPTPTRKRYVFDGWHLHSTTGPVITDDTEVLLTENHYIYAKWIPEDFGGIDPEDAIYFEDPEDIPKGLWTSLTMIKLPDRTYEYTSEKITINNLRVYDRATRLTKGVDYSITYENNVDCGTAKFTIQGKGNYCGKLVEYFTIIPRDVSSSDFIVDNVYVKYNNGKTVLGSPNVYYKGKLLERDTDYKLRYPSINTGAYTNSGAYIVRVEGKGNFTGSKDATEYVLAQGIKPINKVIVASVTNPKYTEDVAVKPVLVLMDGTKKLKEGVHYEIAVECTAIDAGKNYIATVKGIGTYGGVRTVKYNIKGTNINNLSVVINPESEQEDFKYIYDGLPVTPSVTVYNTNGKPVTAGVDYTFSYENNINKGTAKIIIKGKGKYFGTKTVLFKIRPRKITGNMISVSVDSKAVFYDAKGATPNVRVYFNSKLLELGKDYTLSYKNNTGIPGVPTKDKPTVVIKGIGNFAGERSSDTFKITYKTIDEPEFTLRVPNIKGTGVAGRYYAVPKLTDSHNHNLVSGVDFETVYTYSEDTTVKFKGHLEERKAGDLLRKKDIPPVDTVINVEVKGIGGFQGSMYGSYRVTAKNFKNAKISIYSQIIDEVGVPLTITESQVVVIFGGVQLTTADYHIIQDSYKNNTKPGTASVLIEGLGEYGGFQRVTFTIKAKPVGNRIVFNGNGSTSGNMDTIVVPNYRVKIQSYAFKNESSGPVGTEYTTIVYNKYKRVGYTFVGWNTKPDGTGVNVSEQAFINVNTPAVKDYYGNDVKLFNNTALVLYAQWEPNAP